MANFDGLATIANDSGFQNRVKVALGVAAANVYSEAGSTAGHGTRAQFAVKVSQGDYNITSICYAVLSNATIAAEANSSTTPDFAIPDSDIQFAVNSLWNLFSGA